METLLVFAVVFIPMSWAVWRMLRFTRNTIGVNSPMKVSRVYRTSASSFFVTLDSLFIVYGIVAGFFMLKAAVTADFSAPKAELGRLLMLLFAFVLLYIGFSILAVMLNHWHYLRDAVIVTFPDQHEIEITFSNKSFRLRNGDIQKIKIFHNTGRLQLGFVKYDLISGEHFILSFKNSGVWVIQEYFKKFPVEYEVHHLPFISSKAL